jgi:hypothetical protein
LSGLRAELRRRFQTTRQDTCFQETSPKKPTKLDRDQLEAHSAEVSEQAEKNHHADEESSSDDFQDDVNDPDFVDDEDIVRSGNKIIHNSSSTEELQEVPEEPDVIDVVDSDDDDSKRMSSLTRIRNRNQPHNVINPHLPKPSLKYETILIYHCLGPNGQAPKRQEPTFYLNGSFPTLLSIQSLPWGSDLCRFLQHN